MSAIIKIQSINQSSKKSQTPLNAARHNLRAIPAEMKGRVGDRIDPQRSPDNVVLAGPRTPEDVVSLMERLIQEAGAIVGRRDAIKMFEVLVDPVHPGSVTDLDQFFEEARIWLVNWFECPLVSAVVHYDEARPHAHYLFVPLRENRLKGHEVMGKPADLSRLQKQFHEQVGIRFGLKSPQRYSHPERREQAIKALNVLTSQPSRLNEEPIATLLRNQFERCPAEVASAFGFTAESETGTAIAVELDRQVQTATYSVAFDVPASRKAPRQIVQPLPKKPLVQDEADEYQRISEEEIPAQYFDQDRGEFCQLSEKARKAALWNSVRDEWASC